jgi:type III restriction enzyme
MTPLDRCGKTELPVIPNGPEGVRSTAQVDFYTGRDLWAVKKCHLNAIVTDTQKWEQSAAFVLDAHPGVSRWVKNDHLGLRMVYRKGGLPHCYVPDFVAQLDLGLNLIVEVKGLTGDDAQIKQAAARRWVNAVNLDGRHGLWDYKMVRHPADLMAHLDKVCQTDLPPRHPLSDQQPYDFI